LSGLRRHAPLRRPGARRTHGRNAEGLGLQRRRNRKPPQRGRDQIDEAACLARPTVGTRRRLMSDQAYTPPKVWTWNRDKNENRFSNINRPIAGATHEKELPVGKHPFQLYSLATPNGVKVTVMLEELLELGHKGAEYDA